MNPVLSLNQVRSGLKFYLRFGQKLRNVDLDLQCVGFATKIQQGLEELS